MIAKRNHKNTDKSLNILYIVPFSRKKFNKLKQKGFVITSQLNTENVKYSPHWKWSAITGEKTIWIQRNPLIRTELNSYFPQCISLAPLKRRENSSEKRLFLNFLNRFMLYWMKGSSRERRGIASTCRSTGFKLEAGQQWLEVGKWRSFVAIDVAFLANFETQQVKKQYELR